MDAKRFALVIAITLLLPLFVGLFMDAIYIEPKYETYCNTSNYAYKTVPAVSTNCTYVNDPKSDACYRDGGNAEYNYTINGCQEFSYCNYCGKDFTAAQQKYNRNIFLILMPIGLIIVLIGIYLLVDYIGAGLMFAGIIIMFYATMRYFTDMSKILRAIVILIELLIIMWIGYKKIGEARAETKIANSKTRSNTKKSK